MSSRAIALFALGGLAIGTSYTIGSMYPPTLIEFMHPRPAPPSPTRHSTEGATEVERIEEELYELPIVKTLRSKIQDYYETRPYLSYPEEKRIHSLTAGTLRGPGRFAVPPLIFGKWDESESVVVVHVGRSLCGHDGIIHGGLLATILDEALARNAIMNLPRKIGVTANLQLNYRAPTRANQFIVIRTWVEDKKGRKVAVRGRIEDTEGNLLVESSALFVEPKYASMLGTDVIEAAIGAKPKTEHSVVGTDVATTA